MQWNMNECKELNSRYQVLHACISQWGLLGLLLKTSQKLFQYKLALNDFEQ